VNRHVFSPFNTIADKRRPKVARKILHGMLSLIGAALGGVLGHYLFRWILTQGFLAAVVPGAFVGLGCAAFSRRTSVLRGVLCAIAGIGVGLFSAWTAFGPADVGFKEFAIGFDEYLSRVTEVMIALGGLVSFWLGQGSFGALWRRESVQPRTQPPPAQQQ
jgi:hypothetical protein